MIDKEWFIGRYKALKESCKNGCIGCKNVSSKMNCNEIFIRDVIDEYNMKKASDNKFIFKVQGRYITNDYNFGFTVYKAGKRLADIIEMFSDDYIIDCIDCIAENRTDDIVFY